MPVRRLLLGLYVGLLILSFAVQSTVLIAGYLAVCMALVFATVHRVPQASTSALAVMVAVIGSEAMFLSINIPRVGVTELVQAVVGIAAILAAYAATRDAGAYLAASRWGLIGSQLIVLAYLARVGITGFPLENLIPGHSSNGITSYLVAIQVNYCIVNFLLRRRLAWITMLITLAICLVGFGRGSILAAAALLGVAVLVAAAPRAGGSPVLRLVAATAAIAGIIAFRGQIALFADANTKIGAGLVDPSRASILSDYVGQLNAFTVLVGGDYTGTVIESEYNGNPHNSFVRAHHTFGLPYLLVIAVLPLYVVVRARLSIGQKGYVLAALLVLYFRAFTEPILFPTVFDFFLFGMLFVVLDREPPLNALRRGAASQPGQAPPPRVAALST